MSNMMVLYMAIWLKWLYILFDVLMYSHLITVQTLLYQVLNLSFSVRGWVRDIGGIF